MGTALIEATVGMGKTYEHLKLEERGMFMPGALVWTYIAKCQHILDRRSWPYFGIGVIFSSLTNKTQ